MGAHTKTKSEKSHRAFKVIWPLIHPVSSLSLEGKLTIYEILVKPILAYTAPYYLYASSVPDILHYYSPGISNTIFILVGLGMLRLLDNSNETLDRQKSQTKS